MASPWRLRRQSKARRRLTARAAAWDGRQQRERTHDADGVYRVVPVRANARYLRDRRQGVGYGA